MWRERKTDGQGKIERLRGTHRQRQRYIYRVRKVREREWEKVRMGLGECERG